MLKVVRRIVFAVASETHIKRLAREFVLPDEADLVIQKQKYWSPAFCWLYFERCDALIWEAPAQSP